MEKFSNLSLHTERWLLSGRLSTTLFGLNFHLLHRIATTEAALHNHMMWPCTQQRHRCFGYPGLKRQLNESDYQRIYLAFFSSNLPSLIRLWIHSKIHLASCPGLLLVVRTSKNATRKLIMNRHSLVKVWHRPSKQLFSGQSVCSQVSASDGVRPPNTTDHQRNILTTLQYLADEEQFTKRKFVVWKVLLDVMMFCHAWLKEARRKATRMEGMIRKIKVGQHQVCQRHCRTKRGVQSFPVDEVHSGFTH